LTGRGGWIELAPGLSAAEVHSHTDASDGMVSAAELVQAAADAGLAVLCITDHDTIGDLGNAVDLGRRLGVEVVRGEEITCAFPPGTHIVGLFLERAIPMHMGVTDTVAAIHDQGGLAVVAHPFMPTWFASMTERQLSRLIDDIAVDAIEIRHTAPVLPGAWKRLDEFYARHADRLGAPLGAGDSHFGRNDLGRMVTVFPGRTAADLREAIAARTTSPLRALSPQPPSLRQRLRQQRRSMIELNLKRRRGEVGQGA
jgi:predicted metal-dependent phosphoesterase TrpH